VAALAAPLRKLPALKAVVLDRCKVGNEGVASLVANLGKDDFKALETLALSDNKITDVGCASIMKEIDAGGLPEVRRVLDLDLEQNPASDEATAAVDEALVRQGQHRTRQPHTVDQVVRYLSITQLRSTRV